MPGPGTATEMNFLGLNQPPIFTVRYSFLNCNLTYKSPHGDRKVTKNIQGVARRDIKS